MISLILQSCKMITTLILLVVPRCRTAYKRIAMETNTSFEWQDWAFSGRCEDECDQVVCDIKQADCRSRHWFTCSKGAITLIHTTWKIFGQGLQHLLSKIVSNIQPTSNEDKYKGEGTNQLFWSSLFRQLGKMWCDRTSPKWPAKWEFHSPDTWSELPAFDDKICNY